VNGILKSWIDFCDSNWFKINNGKTSPVLRLTSRQQHQANLEEDVILDVLDDEGEQVRPGQVQRLLRVNITENLMWGNCLLTGEKAVILNIHRKLGAL